MSDEVVGVKLPAYITDSSGNPLASLTFSGAEVQVVVDNAAIATATGTMHEIGGTGAGHGAYYYDAAPGDIAGERLTLSVSKSGDAPYVYAQSMRERADLQVGGDDAQWGIPVFLINASTSLPLTGAAPGTGELLVSLDGDAWGNALGTWTEIGAGKYRYLPSSGERATTGLWMLRATPTNAQPFIYAARVGGGSPSVGVIGPAANTTPGALGAFPADYATASETPIVIDLLDDSSLAYAVVFHVQVDQSRRVVYRKGNFEVGYKSYSTQETVSGHVRLHVRADAGWPPLAVELDGDLVDADGNISVLE